MPSGSHYSRGGFSGSSRTGSFGGFSGGHHTSTSIHYHRGPRVMMFFGRPVYMSSARSTTQSLLLGLMAVATFIAIICGIVWGCSVSDLNEVKSYHEFYVGMVENARANPEYIGTATVTDYEVYENGSRYCIYYSINDVNSIYGVNYGHSFYVYRYNQIPARNSTIEIAMNSKNTEIDQDTDSVPMDYADMALSDDAKYVEAEGLIRGCSIGTILAGLTAAGLLVATFVVTLTAQKATPEQMATLQKTENTETGAGNDKWVCAYCKSVNPNSETKCSGCGAKRTK